MARLLFHFYRYAETYTVLLAWIVVPLFFLAIFLFCSKHYGLFVPSKDVAAPKAEGAADGPR